MYAWLLRTSEEEAKPPGERQRKRRTRAVEERRPLYTRTELVNNWSASVSRYERKKKKGPLLLRWSVVFREKNVGKTTSLSLLLAATRRIVKIMVELEREDAYC